MTVDPYKERVLETSDVILRRFVYLSLVDKSKLFGNLHTETKFRLPDNYEILFEKPGELEWVLYTSGLHVFVANTSVQCFLKIVFI